MIIKMFITHYFRAENELMIEKNILYELLLIK
jgi:hypothetical protein